MGPGRGLSQRVRRCQEVNSAFICNVLFENKGVALKKKEEIETQ